MEKYKAEFGSWYQHFKTTLESDNFRKLGNEIHKLRQETKVFPERKDIFRCFRETNYKETNIIIWNDKPYASELSDGLALSSKNDAITPIELSNFLTEIENQIYDGLKLNYTNDLSYLSKQSVLLYNSNLTTSKIRNHTLEWEWFNYQFVNIVNNIDWPIHVISVGEISKSYTNLLNCSVQQIDDFKNAKNCFVNANQFLKENYGPLIEIIW